ncbi:MAG: nucleotidyl transferase AbiEii/AbiGii toxin family protein [Burkholderiales bacterium]
MFYLDVFRCLHKHDVRYVLADGVAMNLHGVPRMTMDIDLVLALDDANVAAFLECARELALKPQAPVPLESLRDPEQRRSWIEEKRLIAFGLSGAPGTPAVDILLKHPLDIAAAIERATVQLVDDAPVRLASVEDMIALKQNTGRRQDEDDVEHLLRLTDRRV